MRLSVSVSFFQGESPEDGADSPPRRHWKESVLVSAEDTSASRTTSPSHQRNGREDRAGPVSMAEETRGSTPPTHPERQSTGPAFQAAAKGSCSSAPFTDRGAVCSEYNQTMRLNHREKPALRCGSGSRSTNGPVQEPLLGKVLHRESPSSSKQLLHMSLELDESLKQSYQKMEQAPFRSAVADLGAQYRERHGVSPLAASRAGSRSGVPGPAEDNHQPICLSYAERNGFGSLPPRFEDGRCSPAPSRSPRLQKLSQHFETDPSPGQGSLPVLSRAERVAALERRMAANGLSVAGVRSKAGSGLKRFGQPGVTHVGPVQMNDCSTTSGSESSESEVEAGGSPLMVGSAAEGNSTSLIPVNRFSFDSLQLDEEAEEEDGCCAFSDEEGAQIFSC